MAMRVGERRCTTLEEGRAGRGVEGWMASSVSPRVCSFLEARRVEDGAEWRALGNKGDLHTRCSIMILPPLSLLSCYTRYPQEKRSSNSGRSRKIG